MWQATPIVQALVLPTLISIPKTHQAMGPHRVSYLDQAHGVFFYRIPLSCAIIPNLILTLIAPSEP
jgi:hypothetical protein